MSPVVSIGKPPANSMHNFGYGHIRVRRRLNDQVYMGIKHTITKQFEIEFGFIP